MKSLKERLAKQIVFKLFGGLTDGSLEVVCPDRTYEFGNPNSDFRSTLVIHDERFFPKALLGGDIGLGEAYMDGDWSSPDPVALVRLMVRNLSTVEGNNKTVSAINRLLELFRHRFRGNSLTGSRKNIRAHYDLSNELFSLFLDQQMVYSSAYFADSEDTLEEAQIRKLDLICRKLKLSSEDHILEIGTGWGAFAIHAARNYGCRVTTTTISRQQYLYAAERIRDLGFDDGRIELLLEDYRNLKGRFSKIVSIEMFEAVGFDYYDEYFNACDQLLTPDGMMLIQTISTIDQNLSQYRKRADWTQKYIFPGGELASLMEILRSLARSTNLALFHAQNIGIHYARTLQEWRRRFHESLSSVRALGYDETFIRMWDFYLACCEGVFRERQVGDYQLLLTKHHNPRRLHEEPDFLTNSQLEMPEPVLIG
jgi:cyclopropane-fatty-acyl-phospholipid synthase